MTINISGQVPGESTNAMAGLVETWIKDVTPDAVYAVVKIERSGFKHDDSKQERKPIMKFTHIEIGDQEELKQLITDLYVERTGENALDMPGDDQ